MSEDFIVLTARHALRLDFWLTGSDRTTSTGAHYHRALTSTRKDSHVSPAGDSRLREDLLEDYYEMCSLLIGAQEQRVPPD